MTASTASQAFADAAEALVEQRDVTHTLAQLLRYCAKSTSADAIGLLVREAHGLELLAATSHQVAELEFYQLQNDTGPCVDCAHTGVAVTALSADSITGRWGRVGKVITAAGYQAVHAVPLRWRGEVLGAMNAFHLEASTANAEALAMTQAFADIATMAIVQSAHLTVADLKARVTAALAGRTAIEQAKGVLAFYHELDAGAAYVMLTKLAKEGDTTLSVAATSIIQEARRRA